MKADNEIFIDEGDVSKSQQTQRALAEIFDKADDIHTHTPDLGALCRNQVLPLEQKYFSNLNLLSIDVVAAEVLNLTPAPQQGNVATVLQSIQNFAGVEAETGMPLQALLVKTWALANHPQAPSNAKLLVIDNLNHNIIAGGGCLAGIAGRLIQPYSAFIHYILQARLEEQKVSQALLFSMQSTCAVSTSPESEEAYFQELVGDEEALRIAIAESLNLK